MFEIYNDDCIPAMQRFALEGRAFDLAVFSPPFASLYTYSDADADMGNSRDSDDEFLLHHEFFVRALFGVIKDGRNVLVHIANPTRSKNTHGHIGVWDLRGAMIRQFERGGFYYYGEVTVDKCPQAQAIRTRAHCLMFVSMARDAAVLRPALADYLLVFKKPGENAVPVRPLENGVTREDWIEWARPIWRGIRETNTLNARAARSDEDERHLCPLQLDLIERCVRLWSNPGETVFSPFAGIGSEGHVACAHGRRFVGTELKPEYADLARRNVADGARLVESVKDQGDLFGHTPVVSFNG